MKILTIIAKRGTKAISQELLKEIEVVISNIAEHVEITEHCEFEAYDFAFAPEIEDIHHRIALILEDLPLDVFYHDAISHKPKKLLIADMDSTLIENECIDEIAAAIGKYKEIAAITEEAMQGNLPFESSLTKRVAELKSVTRSELVDIYNSKIRFSEGVEILAKTLKERGIYLVIVSGGFTEFCNRLRDDLGFDEAHSNVLDFDEEDKLTGKIAGEIFGSQQKLNTLNELMARLAIDKDEVIGIGDGANDLPFLTAIDLSVGHHAKPKIAAQVKANIVKTDLTSILYLLGISRDEWCC